MPALNRCKPFLFLCSICFLFSGCAAPPYIYQPTKGYYAANQITFKTAGNQIECGKPNAVIDGVNHYFLSLPTKFILWNWQILDHQLPDENRAVLEYYLEMNQLTAVKIRHNQYAPIDEFRRLWQNSEVGAGYRATLGMITWLRYTIFPDRVFAGLPLPFIGGGDHFNPFTNSVNVYSSDLGVLLHEAGHAKDYVEHESKGTSFALLRMLPGMDLVQEANASSDAIRFLYCIDMPEQELRAYRTLIPAYSTYISGYFYGGIILTAPIVLSGHITGRVQSHLRARELAQEEENLFQNPFHTRRFLPACCKPFKDRQRSTTDVTLDRAISETRSERD